MIKKSEKDSFWRLYIKSKMALLGVLIVIFFTFVAIFAPYLSPRDPHELSFNILVSPCWEHPLGTDNFGRDVLSRIIWGSRVSITFALGAASISMIVGILIGALAGWYGGIIDNILSRIFEFFIMLPSLFLIIVMVAIFGSNILFTMMIVGLTIWPSVAKIVRAQVLTLKSRSFIDASVGMGASVFRILFIHIVPNGISPIITASTLQISRAVIFEAGLSFMGLGDANYISWGQILYRGQWLMRTGWWISFFSGLVLFFLVYGFNMVREGITQARARESERNS